MAVAIQFGDLVFSTIYARVGEARFTSAVRGATSPVPRSDVAKARTGFRGPRTVQFDGLLASSTFTSRALFVAARDSLEAAHSPGYKALIFDTGRHVDAECRSLEIVEGSTWIQAAQFSISYEAADPYFYGASVDSTPGSPPATGGDVAVTNAGNATALPYFRFEIASGTALDVTVTRKTTSESFRVAGTVAPGDIIVVNSYAQTVTKNGVNWLSALDPLSVWVTMPSGSVTYTYTYTGVTFTSVSIIREPPYY